MKATFVIVTLLELAACTLGRAADSEWDSYKLDFDKIYGDELEEQLRRQIFQDNKRIIDAHNELRAAGAESYEMGVNQFTDMLPEEIAAAIGEEGEDRGDLDLESGT